MAYTKTNRTFSNNKPVYSVVKDNTVTTSNTSLINDPKYSIDGEIVELQKRHYGTKDASQLLDRSFSELTKTKDSVSPANFFNLYRELFFNIPKEGENSHTTLMLESKEYIGDYVDPKDEKVNKLLERIIELEKEKTDFPKEHPIYRNGTAIMYDLTKGPLGIMQEGRFRFINNTTFQTLKRTLGFVNPRNGSILSDKESITVVSKATYQGLAKWPEEARLDGNNDNFNARLSDYLPSSELAEDLKPLVSISSIIQNSVLTKEEVDIIKNALNNKITSATYGIEGNFDGTFKWDTEDLLPFNTKGNFRGSVRLLNTTSADTSYPTSIEIEISDRFNDFANKMAQVGLGINSIKFVDISLNSGQLLDSGNDTERQQAEAFIRAKDQLITDLTNFNFAIINGGGYEQYRWDIDPDRSTTDNNNKFYWVKEDINAEVESPKILAAIDQISNNNNFDYIF